MIGHGSLVNYLLAYNKTWLCHQCRSFALVSTIAADLGNTVIYSSFIVEVCLHLFSKKAVTDSRLLCNYFKEHAIDCLKIVPSHWKALCDNDALLLPTQLLIFGGEALRIEIIEKIRVSGASCSIVNHYGPTETTIGKLLHMIVKARGAYTTNIPIGRPFSNTEVYILNQDFQLCPHLVFRRDLYRGSRFGAGVFEPGGADRSEVRCPSL